MAQETDLLNRMLTAFPEVMFHLRKPDLTVSEVHDYLLAMDPAHYHRIVLHHQHELIREFPLKGVHLTESMRISGKKPAHVLSTSFHSLTEAAKEGLSYSYFFCSPVFPSISKSGYRTDENWNICDQPHEFRKKAVALGGVDLDNLHQISSLGFQHIALLGAVWLHKNPLEKLGQFCAVF